MTHSISSTQLSREWGVSKDYVVRDGRLFAVDDPVRFYRPQDRRELPFEIAKLAEATDDGIVRFAEQWGSLGNYELEKEERLRAELYLGSDLELERPQLGEPLHWIRRHVRQIELCVNLVAPIVTSAEAPAVEAIEHFFQDSDVRLGWENFLCPRFGGGRIQNLLDTFPLDVARVMIAEYVNQGIAGIQPKLDLPNRFQVDVSSLASMGDRTKHPSAGHDFVAMVEIAYLHVAHFLDEQAKISYCEECGKAFEQKHRRQRFCPPGKLYKESPCGYRNRYKKKPRSEWRKGAKKGRKE